MNTATYKSHYGWKSETAIDIGNCQEIRIVTMKRFGGALVTNAQCVRVEGDMISHMLFSDFSKSYKNVVVRCTEKTVLAQHTEVLDQIEQIKADCAAFYAGTHED